jgi:hypothetical protein
MDHIRLDPDREQAFADITMEMDMVWKKAEDWGDKRTFPIPAKSGTGEVR